MIRRLPYVPLILLALTLLIVYFPLLRGEIFYWGLPTLQFYPWRSLAFDLLRDGILPLWNPYNGAGAPLLANYQSALLYPPNWTGLILPLEWSMSVTPVVHLWIAGWGMWRLTGRLGVSDLGRGVSMFAFAMTNYLVARLFTFPIITAAAWLPWIAWAALGVLITGKRRQVAWLALFVALQLLAGHAQTAWYSLTLVGAFALWWTIVNPTPAPPRIQGGEQTYSPGQTPTAVGALDLGFGSIDLTPDPDMVGMPFMASAPHDHPDPETNGRPEGHLRWLRLAGVMAGMVLGAGIATLQLAPTAELLSQSQRSDGVDFDFAMNFSYAPARALNFLSPVIFGTPADGTYFTQGAYFEDAVYIGLIPLIGAFVAVIAWWRRRKSPEPIYRSVPFWLTIVIVGFVFALGVHTPIFPFLYRNIPTFDLFQAPVRWHLWTVFGLSILAGIGVSAWGRGRSTRRWSRRALVAAIGAVILLLVAQPYLTLSYEPPGILMRVLTGISALIGVAAILSLLQPPQTSPRYRRWLVAVLGVIAVDLALASWGLNPTITQETWTAEVGERRTDLTVNGWRTVMPSVTEEALKFNCFFRFDDYRTDITACSELLTWLPNANIYERVSYFNNFDPLLVGHYASYSQRGQGMGQLSAAAIGSFRSGDGASSSMTGWWRGWLVESVCWHETEAQLEAALDDLDWDAYVQIHMLGDAGCPPVNVTFENANVILTDHINTVTISMNASRDGWLYLADTDYPGWKATVDGDPVPIYRANLMFRAVQVDAGLHRVEFSYQPDWIAPALLITGVSLILLVFLFRVRE